ALALLAVNAAHIHFSRLGIDIAPGVLFAALALYALWHAKETKRPFWWLLAGILGTLPAYIHFGGRLMPAIMAVFLVYLLVNERHAWRSWLYGLTLLILAAAMTAAPLLMYLSSHGAALISHVNSRIILTDWPRIVGVYGTNDAVQILWGQLKTNLLAFVARGDAGLFYYFAGAPLFTIVLAPLFVLGLALMLFRIWDSRYALLALWFWVLVVAGGVLTFDPPQDHRLVPALLPAIMAIALLLDWLGRSLATTLGGLRPQSAFAVLMLVPVVAGYTDLTHYFGPVVSALPWEGPTAQAHYVAALGPRYRFYSIGSPTVYFEHVATRYLAPEAQGATLPNPAASLPVAAPGDRDVVFLVFPQMYCYLPLLDSLYPAARKEETRNDKGKSVFFAYFVSREDVVEHQGLLAKVASTTQTEHNAAALTADVATYPADVVWAGSIFADRSGTYRLQADGAAKEIVLDGTSLGADGKRNLQLGWHEIEVRGQMVNPADQGILRWQPPKGKLAPVPAQWLDDRTFPRNVHGQLLAEDGTVLAERQDGTIGFRYVGELFGAQKPATAKWDGTLEVLRPGRYQFQIQATGEAELFVDGVSVAIAGKGQTTSFQTIKVASELSAGRHQIEVLYKWRYGAGTVELLWSRPDVEPTIIAPESFAPPR
ncbi:MAG: PA14 domain-containing protein, partial [Chloroflexota bacterium]